MYLWLIMDVDITEGVDMAGFAGAGAIGKAFVPFSTATMIRGAYDVYAYKKAYGRSPKYVTPWGPRSMARIGGRSIAPRDVTRYYR